MRHLITSLALLTLAACGGGGGGSSSNTLSGTAATGAPLSGASIEVYNASGIKVATATADSSGKYTSSALLGEGPYVIKATSGTTELYSVQSSADGSVVNVTPLSNLVATLLSPTGNAGNLVTEFGADKTLLSSTGINDKKTIVKSIAAPVATAIGLGDFDVINTAMVANGTGLDQVLDTVRVGITHEGTSSSIQIVYKTADGTSTPQTITFTSNDSRSNVIASVNGVSFTSRDLYDSSMTAKLNVWLDRLNACSRIPANQRWSGEAGHKTLIADTCKKLFFNNDPSLFKHFGVTAEQAFTYTFSNRTWTEAEPSRQVTEPEYIYSSSDGEVIVKMKAKLFNDDESSYYRYYFFNLSPDLNNNNELRSKGNQYTFETNMSTVNYIKSFPYSTGYNYTYSGYSFDIPTEGTNGDSSISSIPYSKTVVSAKVTSPTGEITYLKKKTGRSRLVVCPSSSTLAENCSYSPFRSVGSTFFDSSTAIDTRYSNPARTRPSEYDSYGSVNFGQKSDSEIKKLPMIGTYTVELTLSDNTTVTQKVPFFGRPKTHQEIIAARSNNKFPILSSEFVSSLFRSRTDDLSTYRISSELSIWPVKWLSETNHSMGIEPAAFNFSWSNIAQYIFMHGETTGIGYFELRKEISTSERTKTFDCFQYASINACNGSTSQFKWNQSGDSKYSVIKYMEIGNYFSDFGTNISAYEFYAIENGDRNPYAP